MERNKATNLMDVVVKELLQKKKTRECCRIAFLSGAFKSGLELRLRSDDTAFALENDNRTFMDYVAFLLESMYGITVDIEENSRTVGKKNWIQYRIELSLKEAKAMLTDCCILDSDGSFIWDIKNEMVAKRCDKRSYLQGVFLSCGYVKAPSEIEDTKSGYQMEFKFNSLGCAEGIKSLIAEVCLVDGDAILARKDQPTLYVRSSEVISDILAGLKASRAVIILNQISATRAMKNTINRGANVEAANIDRIYAASGKQKAMILYLKENGLFSELSDKLREVAELRLLYPLESLEELAMRIPNCTKSAINHRFRKIAEIYESEKSNTETED